MCLLMHLKIPLAIGTVIKFLRGANRIYLHYKVPEINNCLQVNASHHDQTAAATINMNTGMIIHEIISYPREMVRSLNKLSS